MKFGQLILRKVIQIAATKCHIFRLKVHQIRFRLGLRPRPRWGLRPKTPVIGSRSTRSPWPRTTACSPNFQILPTPMGQTVELRQLSLRHRLLIHYNRCIYRLSYKLLLYESQSVLGAFKYKCTKHQFIHLLTATFNDLHIENSKNYKR